MEALEIKSKLCYCDERNPNGTKDEEIIKQKKVDKKNGVLCYCDNCFYGRTQLAEELLNCKNNIGYKKLP